jgi:uncharacterized protein (DUF488 family)
MAVIWTVGHSTRSIEDFISLLASFEIDQIVDIRTVPRSRWNPQFNKDALEKALPDAGIAYMHAKDLGGLRTASKKSVNMGWRNESFRGFADYMQTPEFDTALQRFVDLAEGKRAALLCAEIVPWKCHRSLIADVLLTRGFEITEIMEEGKSQPHKLTPFAVVQDGKVTYPKQETKDGEG